MIVRSSDPETIKVPSWLKLTELMPRLCALVFSLIKVKESAAARTKATVSSERDAKGKKFNFEIAHPRL